MQQENISFYDWQQKYSTHEECLNYISSEKWPNGFECPHCQNNHGYYTANRYHYECSLCHKQTSIISGTLFENTKIPLTKWFWAIYWISSDKGGIPFVFFAPSLRSLRYAFIMVESGVESGESGTGID